MDASVQLALMSKAKLVFENEADSFLCFPALTPLTYTPDQLKFVPAPSGAAMAVFSELSRLTNALPQDVVFQPSLDTFLWDKYLHVLRDAELAQGDLSAQQQADYQEAQSFLYTKNPDGTTSPSAAKIAYDQYRQAYLLATQAYKAAQLTASASSDPAVQAQWQNTDQPRLQAQVQAAESAWETKGFKAQVEQAQQVQQAYTAQSPALQWQIWASECNPDIDFLTDSNNQSFGPTVYSPYDILDQGDWPTFTLTSSEIQQLVSQAPPELTKVLGAADTDQVVSSGQGTLRGTWMFSFDTGAEVGSGSSDVWWDQMTNVDRQLVPKAPAGIVNLGNANFDAINVATLQGYQYGSTPIPGSANTTNQLTPGDVFAVRTSGGNYAKVQVISYGYNLGLRWTTYKTSNVEALSFQFSSVGLCRPWYHPDVFAARFWRFANPSEQLSDGNVPATGDWPAYITAVVFARNIVVTQHTPSGPVNQPIKSFPRVFRDPLLVGHSPIQNEPAVTPTPVLRNPVGSRIEASPIVERAPVVAAVASPVVERAPVAAAVSPVRVMHPAVMTRLSAATFASVPASGTPGGGTSTQTTSGGQISILAFICKRLPKCPNPDPSLTWG